MFRANVYCAWDLLNEDFELPVELYCDDHFCHFNPDTKAIKILFLNEPKEILKDPTAHALEYGSQYDVILTWDVDILKALPNAMFFRNDICWVGGEYDFPEKKFGISTIVGNKTTTVGHSMRHQLWDRQDEITTPKAFYTSYHGGPKGDLVLRESKLPLFDYQFHIVIENVKATNMLSEKLTDACRLKTIPIYWGCPNVEDTFDPRGIIQCNSLDEIIEVSNKVTPELYEEMLLYAEENYQRTLQKIRADGHSRIGETITDIINKIKKDGTNIF